MERLKLAAAMAAFCASFSAAGQVTVVSGWIDVGVVTRLHAGDNATPEFYFSTATQAMVTACSVNNAGYEFSTSGSNASRNYATLLLAYSMGKPVSIYLNGGCGNAGRPAVTAVELREPQISYF